MKMTLTTDIRLSDLQLASAYNGRNTLLVLRIDGSTRGASGLNCLDDKLRLAISDFTKDNVLAIEPAGRDSGDEKLGSVGVRSGIGHREQERLGVFLSIGGVKILVLKLLAVDRLAASSISASEIATLKHELRDDAVELGVLVTETLLASAKSTEVLDGLGNDLIVEDEIDSTLLALDLT